MLQDIAACTQAHLIVACMFAIARFTKAVPACALCTMHVQGVVVIPYAYEALVTAGACNQT